MNTDLILNQILSGNQTSHMLTEAELNIITKLIHMRGFELSIVEDNDTNYLFHFEIL